MKALKFLPLLLLFILSSCSSVQVAQDYDTSADFSKYKSYAFFKSGIDKVEISDLDKKRILRSVEAEMNAKGFSKSESPDLLINIFTKSRENVNVNQFNHFGYGWGWGYGWGYNPYLWGGTASVSTSTEGTLYIDLIDAKTKELIWQGEGVGVLTQNTTKKEERIREFVAKILAQYPPSKN